MTPLHLAVESGSIDVVKTLFCCAAVTRNPKNNDGNTPLNLAIKLGFVDIVKFICENGEVPEMKDFAEALRSSCVDVLDYLLSMKSLHDWKCSNPLCISVEGSNTQIAEMLLSTDGVDICAKNEAGMTAMMIAAKLGDVEILDAIMRKVEKPISENLKVTCSLSVN